MNAHNKTQFIYARINSVLKDSSCDTPLPKILMLAILATCAIKLNRKYLSAITSRMIPYSHTEVNQFKIRNQMQRSHSKRGTQCMSSPIGLPVFSNQHDIKLNQDHKGLSRLVMGLRVKI